MRHIWKNVVHLENAAHSEKCGAFVSDFAKRDPFSECDPPFQVQLI